MFLYHGGTPTWWLHTGLSKFVKNISKNIWGLEKRKEKLKLGEMSSWLEQLDGFWIVFLLRDIESAKNQ